MWRDMLGSGVVRYGHTLVGWLQERFGRQPIKPFPTLAEGALVPRPLGLQVLPVAQIGGSVDRWQELAADFRPRGWRTDRTDDQRYQWIETAVRRGLALPPIVVYRLDGDYYVLDGHHRVAAARALGQAFLDAEVIEYQRIPQLVVLGAGEVGRPSADDVPYAAVDTAAAA